MTRWRDTIHRNVYIAVSRPISLLDSYFGLLQGQKNANFNQELIMLCRVTCELDSRKTTALCLDVIPRQSSETDERLVIAA